AGHEESGSQPSSEGNGDEGLEHLLDAACRTISRRGFSATRVADIAAEAGVSPATVHYHFKTRHEILVDALLWANARLVKELERANRNGDPPLVRIARFLERTVPHPGAREDEYRLEIDIWGQARHHPELLGPYEGFAARWTNELAEMIEDGVAAGELAPTVETPELVERLVALTDGLAARAVTGSAAMPPDRVHVLLFRFAAEQLGIEPEELERHAELPPLRSYGE
ncbi:MAG TPA: TetR family transcriptional regulator C-terminal domain-containing protein, partial [Solirubrobacterales bacterium]|nr:TetR family transcriptional regulator C-terminal domain-containing protein [Solirubrobacterales bacterium]